MSSVRCVNIHDQKQDGRLLDNLPSAATAADGSQYEPVQCSLSMILKACGWVSVNQMNRCSLYVDEHGEKSTSQAGPSIKLDPVIAAFWPA